MRQWIRSHLTFANVVSLTALFVALGGTTYAATGGNFILGQSNTAGAPTSLSAPVAGKALQLTNTSTATGATALGLNTASGHPPLTVSSGAKVANLNADKLDGKNANAFLSSTPPVSLSGSSSESIFHANNDSSGPGVSTHSDSGTGVLGHSQSWIGAWGASNQYIGVLGTSQDPSGTGVYGQNGAGDAIDLSDGSLEERAKSTLEQSPTAGGSSTRASSAPRPSSMAAKVLDHGEKAGIGCLTPSPDSPPLSVQAHPVLALFL